MDRVVLTIFIFTIATQPTQCAHYYDDNTQSIKTSCIDFMEKDTTYKLDKIRSTSIRMKKTDINLTESMNKVVNNVNEYECLDCMSNGNSSDCACSTSVPIHPDDLVIMTQLFTDRSLWHTTFVCDQVADKASNEKLPKPDQRSPLDLTLIRVIVCIITTVCFPITISPSPTITSKTLSPSPSKTPLLSVSPLMAPNLVPTSIDVTSCSEALVLSDMNNNTYIDRYEYLIFIRTLGCEDIFRLTKGLAEAFTQTRLVANSSTLDFHFSIASVYKSPPDVEKICNITIQALEKEDCMSSRIPSLPVVPNPTPVRPWRPLLTIPPFIRRPTTVPVVAPIQPDPTLRTPFLTDTPSFSADTEECLQFFLKSNVNNDDRLTESEYLNFVMFRTNCRSLRSLPQQLAANLLSWCEEDFDVRSCKSRLEFATDNKLTINPNGRLNTLCAPIVVSCPSPQETPNPVLEIVPSSRPDGVPSMFPESVPSMFPDSVPITRPDSVPFTRVEIYPTSVPESPNVESLGPDAANATKIPPLQLQKCIGALAEADMNNDTRLDITEYTALIVDYFLCPGGTSTLSESQLKVFHDLSCKCEKLPNATRVCCLERNARIDIAGVYSPNRSELEIAELEDVCINSENARDNACSEPVLAPNQSPVVANPAIEVSLAGNSLPPVVSPTTFGYGDCGLHLFNSDSDRDNYLNESEYLQFLRYRKCNVTVLTEQQNKTFFQFVANSGSENRSIAMAAADPFVPNPTGKEIEFLTSICYLEELCPPEEVIMDCTEKLAIADSDKNKELDETELSSFIVDYLQCPPTSRMNASKSFTSVTSALNTTTINIIGANNALICSLAKVIGCQDSGDKCTANMILADGNSDGMVGTDEYLIFSNKQLNDCNGSELPYLSLAHRTTFQIASCLDCLLRAQVDVKCCHPHNAYISTDYFTMQESQRSELQKGIVRDVCVSTSCASMRINYSVKNTRIDLTFPVLLLLAMIMLAISCIRLYYVNDVY